MHSTAHYRHLAGQQHLSPTFNEANLLDKVDVNLRGAAAATPFVTNIDYNAKGHRELIAYDNGALGTTTYDYDPLTFRLTHLKTTRPANQMPLPRSCSRSDRGAGSALHL